MNKEIVMIGTGNYEPITVLSLAKGTVELKGGAIAQIVDATKYVLKKKIMDFPLLARINSKFMAEIILSMSQPIDLEAKPFVMEFTGHELSLIKEWLLAKHNHCEKNREDKEFNLETLYYLKDFMLSIREMLLLTKENK